MSKYDFSTYTDQELSDVYKFVKSGIHSISPKEGKRKLYYFLKAAEKELGIRQSTKAHFIDINTIIIAVGGIKRGRIF